MKHGGSAPCSLQKERRVGAGPTPYKNAMNNEFTDRGRLAAIWAEARASLAEALPEVTHLMKEKFDEVHGEPTPGSALDQHGLGNGAEVVRSFIQQNELGLALEHLCYMVNEADLAVSSDTYASLKAAEQIMQMHIPALKRIKPPIR